MFTIGTLTISGCGGTQPGAHMEDTTPGGDSTPTISEDPEKVGDQMGSDYAKETGGKAPVQKAE